MQIKRHCLRSILDFLDGWRELLANLRENGALEVPRNYHTDDHFAAPVAQGPVQNQFTDRHEAGGVRGKIFWEFLAAGACMCQWTCLNLRIVMGRSCAKGGGFQFSVFRIETQEEPGNPHPASPRGRGVVWRGASTPGVDRGGREFNTNPVFSLHDRVETGGRGFNREEVDGRLGIADCRMGPPEGGTSALVL
jgi:hypothetical protein